MDRTRHIWIGVIGLLAFVLLFVGIWLVRVKPGIDNAPAGNPAKWTQAELEGSKLRISYDGSSCETSHDVVVEEGDDRVVLTLYTQDSGQTCTMQVVRGSAVAELDDPLGDRDVYDGACLLRGNVSEASCRRETD